MTVLYPALRNELILAVRSFADEEYQKKVWIQNQLPFKSYGGCFETSMHMLLDDLSLNDDIEKVVGSVIYPHEVSTVKAFVSFLTHLMDKVHYNFTYGTYIPEVIYMQSPDWPKAVMLAKECYLVLTNGQQAEGFFEELASQKK